VPHVTKKRKYYNQIRDLGYYKVPRHVGFARPSRDHYSPAQNIHTRKVVWADILIHQP